MVNVCPARTGTGGEARRHEGAGDKSQRWRIGGNQNKSTHSEHSIPDSFSLSAFHFSGECNRLRSSSDDGLGFFSGDGRRARCVALKQEWRSHQEEGNNDSRRRLPGTRRPSRPFSLVLSLSLTHNGTAGRWWLVATLFAEDGGVKIRLGLMELAASRRSDGNSNPAQFLPL